MRNYLFYSLALFLTLSVLPVLHADEREAFQRFGDYIVGGTWHGETPDGTALEHTYRWALGKQFLFMVENDTALHIVGVDPSDGALTRWAFNANGSVAVLKSKEQSTGENTSRVTIVADTATNLANQQLDITYAEDKLVIKGASLDETWTREPLEGDFPSLESAPPKDMPRLMKAISGPKWVSGGISGDKIYGTTLGHWVLDGKFFLFTSTFLGKDDGAWGLMYVFGNDPRTGKPTGWEFGGFEYAVTKWTLTNEQMTITGKATMPGNAFTFSGTHSLRDNGLVEYEASGKMTDDPSEIPYGWTYYPVK